MRVRSHDREYGHVQVVGYIWQPGIGPCAMERDLSDYDVGNINHPIDRDSVLDWIYLHMGDFQEIIDFSAQISASNEKIDIPWSDEENELIYFDCMYPSDEVYA